MVKSVFATVAVFATIAVVLATSAAGAERNCVNHPWPYNNSIMKGE